MEGGRLRNERAGRLVGGLWYFIGSLWRLAGRVKLRHGLLCESGLWATQTGTWIRSTQRKKNHNLWRGPGIPKSDSSHCYPKWLHPLFLGWWQWLPCWDLNDDNVPWCQTIHAYLFREACRTGTSHTSSVSGEESWDIGGIAIRSSLHVPTTSWDFTPFDISLLVLRTPFIVCSCLLLPWNAVLKGEGGNCWLCGREFCWSCP